MTVWIVVVVVSALTVAIKATGPVLLGGRRPAPVIARMLGLTAPALLCALVGTGVFAQGHRLVLDARAVGLAIAGVAIWRRAPPLVVVILAAATTATIRALRIG